MASQLVIDGQMIELEETIDYSFNTGNIADMSLSKSNYTQAFNIPRLSLQAVKLFNGLGIPTHISTTPYEIKNVDVLDNYSLVYTANLILLETTEEFYKATAISGTYDIFALMGNKTFADIPEIVSTLPLKTVPNVASLVSNTNNFVIFSIANYGGITHLDDGSETRINIDCMAISYNIQYLFDLIFRFIGVIKTENTGMPFSLESHYFTFPYPPINDIVEADTIAFSGLNTALGGNVTGPSPAAGSTNFTNVISSSLWSRSGRTFTCVSTGRYMIEFKDGIIAQYFRNLSQPKKGLNVVFKKNGNQIATVKGYTVIQGDRQSFKFIESFNSGDVLTWEYLLDAEDNVAVTWYTGDNNFSISTIKISNEGIKAILGFKISDYVKEFMYRFALIGFLRGTQIDFINIKSIIDSTPVDWSDKYHKRTNEIYDIGWNQNNYLKHRYVNESENYYDLNITSQNLNTPAERDIIKSNVFVPSQGVNRFNLGGAVSVSNSTNVRGYVTYSSDNSNKVKTENRNFWLRNDILTLDVVLGSFTMNERAQISGNVNVAYEFDLYYNQSDNWKSIKAIVDQPKQDTLELNLDITDIVNLDQSRLYFFEQESAYFMLSELRFKSETIAIAKFNKVIR
ncbi:hypothetical protein D3C87_935140 [compost metagenome]